MIDYKHEAFVYLWYDSNNKKYYYGSHKVSKKPGKDTYAHSSTLMESFNMNSVPPGFSRKIIAEGSHQDMLDLEIKILQNRFSSGKWHRYWNVCINKMPYMWKDPEYRKKMSNITKEFWKDPEYRKKMSKKSKERWKDPEYRKMRSEQVSKDVKEFWKDPEYRKKMSEQRKERWKDPEYRKKISEQRKERWKDPEYRKKISKKIKCVHCDYEGLVRVVYQFHNDNCKHKNTSTLEPFL